jgi:hypothetical protein
VAWNAWSTDLSAYADPATSQKREEGAVTCFLASSEGWWQSGRMRRTSLSRSVLSCGLIRDFVLPGNRR